MLRVCTEPEFRKYVDFVYELALDQSKSGYPTYSDGIKTKEMFLDGSQQAFSRDTEEILLFEYEGTVEGWIHYYFLPEDKYLSTVSFNIDCHIEQALREFLEFAYEQFKGYDLFLGYSTANQKAIDFLLAHGFECIEESYYNTAFFNEYEPVIASDCIVRVTRDNYELFRTLHRKTEKDMYWNSERIYADIDNWVLFVKLHHGETIGSVYFMNADDGWFEIFGIDRKEDTFDSIVFCELLGSALHAARELGGKYMTFFCEEEEQETVGKMGFTCVGKYVCYKKHLIVS